MVVNTCIPILLMSLLYALLFLFPEEFSLKIVQLSLEDDDRYQCQVMATANSSSLVSQFAYVDVLGKI